VADDLSAELEISFDHRDTPSIRRNAPEGSAALLYAISVPGYP
jgi:hypothetical protein